MKLYEIILKSSYELLKKQNIDGSMPAGHNWPYFHDETNIRNTFHWAILFLKAYEISNDELFLDAAKKIADYVIKINPEFNFNFRSVDNRDSCNWLIGPAWCIESLLIMAKKLNKPELEKLAKKIFLNHNFNEELWLWYRREIDWTVLWIDWTFNHQLWFAAVWSMFDKKHTEIHNKINRFNCMLDKSFSICYGWLIRHHIVNLPLNREWISRRIYKIKNLLLHRERDLHKAVWYHSFNVYWFLILKENYPELDFWNSSKFKEIIKFFDSKLFNKLIVVNKYWYDYNVTWIEAAYALQKLVPLSGNKIKDFLLKQFEKNYDYDKNLLCKNTDDPETLSLRLYEATRLSDLEFKNSNFKSDRKPFVSVIIPHYNDTKRLEICLDRLVHQTYDKNNYEVIIVDNNSTEDISYLKNKYNSLMFLEQNEIQGSYASRNKWIKKSNWDILAFTDSDCTPNLDWIENWVNLFLENNYDLISWKVEFIFTDKNDPYEIFDSINSIQQYDKSLKWEGATANLFVYKYVFDKIWLFDKSLISWWDTAFTSNCTKKWLKLFYSNKVIVKHPTRNKKWLLKKCIRIWFGQISVRKMKNKNTKFYMKRIIKLFLPSFKNNHKLNFWFLLNSKVFYVSWLCKMYWNIWMFKYLYSFYFKNKK